MTENKIHPIELPACPGLNIGALSALFDHTDTSYKFLWMLSILDLMPTHKVALPAEKIVKRMLEIARPLVQKHRLRFGAKDRMNDFLESTKGEQLPEFILKEILRFVPYRLLSPFFVNEIKNLAPNPLHRLVRKLANARFSDSNSGLYRFIGQAPEIESIELHPKWHAYLVQNAEIVRGWAMWKLVLFLQTRNSNRPNIAKQLIPEISRPPLTSQRNFWKRIIVKRRSATINCIYSGDPLSETNFALDHYIPFDFVGHNDVWNLLPVSPSANSAKSASLPHERYFDDFINLHYEALIMCREKFITNRIKNKIFAEYSEGLGIAMDETLTKRHLYNAYQTLMSPLLTIAKSYGFAPDWEYKPY